MTRPPRGLQGSGRPTPTAGAAHDPGRPGTVACPPHLPPWRARGPGSAVLAEPPLHHVVARQQLEEHVRRRTGDVRGLVGRGLPEHLRQHVVVHPDELEQAHAPRQGSPADLVARVPGSLLVPGQVPEEGRTVTAGHAVGRPHGRPGERSARRPPRSTSPSSRSSAVATWPVCRPSWTIAKATSGWMPTITVTAPRSRAISPMSLSVRV